MILPRSAIKKQGKYEDPSMVTDNYLKGWTSIIEPIIDIILIELRQTFFIAFRHASIDCWAFANILATKLTLAAIFGDNALDNTSKRDFARHVELVKFYRDQIALDIVCGRQQHASKKMRLCRLHLQEIDSTIATAFARKRVESVCGYVYGDSYVRPPRSEELCQLVIGVHQATTNILFWAISAISQDKCIRSVIEQEADASLRFTGEIDKNSLNAIGIARSLCEEVIRLDPPNNIFIFSSDRALYKKLDGLKVEDKLILCPYVFFRSKRIFQNENAIAIGRRYEKSLSNLQSFACGGRVVYDIVLLNAVLFLLDIATAFELELVQGPGELTVVPTFQSVRPDIKIRLNLRRSRLFR